MELKHPLHNLKDLNLFLLFQRKKIKKQGGSPSEISNRRKTQYKIIKDANKELKKFLKVLEIEMLNLKMLLN